MSALTEPTDGLDDAMKAKDIDKFHKAYVKLAAACDACHEEIGFGFIKIRTRVCRRSRPFRSSTSRFRASELVFPITAHSTAAAGLRRSIRFSSMPAAK
jgi:hypothetical protein